MKRLVRLALLVLVLSLLSTSVAVAADNGIIRPALTRERWGCAFCEPAPLVGVMQVAADNGIIRPESPV